MRAFVRSLLRSLVRSLSGVRRRAMTFVGVCLHTAMLAFDDDELVRSFCNISNSSSCSSSNSHGSSGPSASTQD